MKKAYVYANSQPLIRYDGSPKNPGTDIYFYLHDRLSSVRLLIDADGNVVNSYTYNPFGKDFATEVSEEIDNSFKFTGQFYDDEISQYYLRARQYDPQLMRFTSIDPVKGEQPQPLTLHRYLYCVNDPLNRTDPSGEIYLNVANGLQAAVSVYALGLSIATYGAANDNFDLLVAGAYIMELSPLAYALGLGFGDKMVTVTRWGNPGTGKGFVMAGHKNYINYALSGKWLGTKSNQFAAYGTGHSWEVMASELGVPSGWGWFKAFFGQVVIK